MAPQAELNMPRLTWEQSASAARDAFNSVMRVTQWKDEPDALPNGMLLLPAWEDLPAHVKEAWVAAVRALQLDKEV